MRARRKGALWAHYEKGHGHRLHGSGPRQAVPSFSALQPIAAGECVVGAVTSGTLSTRHIIYRIVIPIVDT